jgi:hypothetical protein
LSLFSIEYWYLSSTYTFYNGRNQNPVKIRERERERSAYLSFEVWLDRIDKLNCLRIGQGLASWWQSVIR